MLRPGFAKSYKKRVSRIGIGSWSAFFYTSMKGPFTSNIRPLYYDSGSETKCQPGSVTLAASITSIEKAYDVFRV